jgi:hypothetical protein
MDATRGRIACIHGAGVLVIAGGMVRTMAGSRIRIASVGGTVDLVVVAGYFRVRAGAGLGIAGIRSTGIEVLAGILVDAAKEATGIQRTWDPVITCEFSIAAKQR